MIYPSLDFPPFNTLSDEVIADLMPKLILKTYAKDTFIFTKGQPSIGFLLIIIAGTAGIIAEGDNPSSNVLSLRYAGDLFGESILTGKTYPASVKAVEELTCYLLKKEIFEDLLQTQNNFAGFFSNILTQRLRDMYDQMVQEQPFDSYGHSSEPFKHRLKDIMSTPVMTCSPSTPISQVARIFSQQHISTIVIIGTTGKLLGLVSERDLINKVLALDCNPAIVFASDIMDKTPPTLPPDAFFYEALLTMIKRHDKYILIAENGFPLGVITMGDLTRLRKTSTLSIVSRIESAKTTTELSHAAKLIQKVTVNMVSDKASANEICEVVSELNDLITRRLLVLAEEALEKCGLGLPPLDYCWLTLGSGGRKEQTLSSDQDNALIYAEPPLDQEQAIKEYFLTLANFVVNGLEEAGFPKCQHNIMASNPDWCQSLQAWKTSGDSWIFTPTEDSFRKFTIFLDFRAVYGQEKLAQELRDFAHRLFRLAPSILHHMAKDDLQTRVPLGLFKQIILDKKQGHKDEVDIKGSACVHIVDCIRIFAMREGILDTSTLARLNKLVSLEAISADDAEYYEAAYLSLMMFRIRGNLQKLSQGLVPDNYLKPSDLSKRQRTVLRESLIAIDRLQTFTGSSFRVEGYL
ncbi:DUF294 nucleotidyltransferase-like domain-containing protein [Desulfosporosinus sp. BICA1-9]|uniref:DUF294 nucleotidyltransferase-like domain-containing protein n=1 Tax=Desulfosporosinus sp. BICA1-9 TaxID=1531958 RepID=UPI00054C4D9B|nr:DUF294 nucleotidyltransferase-like domain-containing protein [Desulfosporosinus sp. BICA1-9]KJS47152.1 MAG: hypothetical protein VR66_21295 [Peptococcaceae bacterium BRH_c23]KJS85985.1 MAG: hypothetical protein JL57_17560 [Desulfosporosinus sp. BICA1-9]HBW34407.1 CBS domain-containing protein [Desulfosporosinus sp.]